MADGSVVSVLMVGDRLATRSELQEYLGQRGIDVLTAKGAAEALHLLARFKIGCMLMDAGLEPGSAPDFVARVLEREPALAVVIVARDQDLRTGLQLMRRGALDCLDEAEAAPEIEAAVRQALERRRISMREDAMSRSLREEVGKLSGELRQARARVEDLALATLESLVCVVEAKDPWLAGHSVRVAQLAASLAAEMSRNDAEIESVRIAGRLHDIGMICLADGILSKKGPLTPDEFVQIKRHVIVGSDIVSPLPEFGAVSRFVRHHHERWDGHGYPDRLGEDEIPWGARLIGAAEIYDAFTTKRPYRKPISPESAVAEMKKLIGTTIAPQVHEALAAVVGRRRALIFLDDQAAEIPGPSTAARAATLADSHHDALPSSLQSPTTRPS
jgi:HD-GYP domain-containing protein (c-di-GMP phosphodiesterase class II)